MFTSLSTILGIQPRHAEQSDTRQDIQRHDPDHERRRKKKKDSEEELFDEDGATVAVSALTAFLNKFLKELSEKQPKQGFNATSAQTTEKVQEQESPEDQSPEEAPPPIAASPHAAKAANAYQHMAESQQSHSILGDINESNADLISLDAAEVRTIHALLEDLKLLSDKGIEYIHIDRAENFLQSLVNAVNTVKKSKLFQQAL